MYVVIIMFSFYVYTFILIELILILIIIMFTVHVAYDVPCIPQAIEALDDLSPLLGDPYCTEVSNIHVCSFVDCHVQHVSRGVY